MKPARFETGMFLSALLAIPACAQSSATYGTRIGQVQTAYLEDVPASTAAAQDISDRFREILDAARASGVTRLAVGADGRPFAPPTGEKGPRAEFETWVEQKTRDYAESVVSRFSGIERDGERVAIRRSVRDNFRQIEMAYTMTLERVVGAAAFRVVFRDASVPVPVPQVLRDGETIALELAADPRSGRRLVDYIRVGTGPMKPRQEPARDVYAEDAELTLTQPHLRINGEEQPIASVSEPVSARVVWADVPGQGRFLLSFKPRKEEGFQRAGEVGGNSLVFSSGGNIVRIDCSDRIATGSGTYNIYVRKDPARDSPTVTFGAQP